MAITIDGTGTISGVSVGGLPDGAVTPSDLSTGHPNWDSSGNVGIGTSSPRDVAGYASLAIDDTSGSLLDMNVNGTRTTSLTVINTQTQFGTITNTPLTLWTNNAERMRILSSGGITFNGDTASANALNDYETGSFTPDIKNESSSSTWTTKLGKYVKVGNLVTCWGYCDGGNSGSSGSSIRIYNLPFTNTQGWGAGSVGTFIYNGGGSSWGIQLGTSSTTATPYGASAGNTNTLTYTAFFVTYYVA